MRVEWNKAFFLTTQVYSSLAFAFPRCGLIAKHKLGRPLRGSLLIYVINIVGTGVRLAARIVRQQRIDQPLVECGFPAVRRDAQHVINIWLHFAVSHGFRAVGKAFNQILLIFAGFDDNIVETGFRTGEI